VGQPPSLSTVSESVSDRNGGKYLNAPFGLEYNASILRPLLLPCLRPQCSRRSSFCEDREHPTTAIARTPKHRPVIAQHDASPAWRSSRGKPQCNCYKVGRELSPFASLNDLQGCPCSGSMNLWTSAVELLNTLKAATECSPILPTNAALFCRALHSDLANGGFRC
jgi:hypothetical protein